MEKNEALEQATRARFEEWDLPKMNVTDQIERFQNELVPQLINVYLTGDQVDIILVAKELEEALTSTIQGPWMPTELKDVQAELQMQWTGDSEFRSAVARTISTIPVQALSVEELAADPDQMSVGDQFVRVTTRSLRIRTQVEVWYRSTGLQQHFYSKGLVVEPSYAEKRILFLFSSMNEMVMMQSQQLRQAQMNPQDLILPGQ